MRTTLLAATLILVSTDAAHAGTDTWTTAYKRGDYRTAATLLQRAVFETPRSQAPDPAAIKQLALLYGDGKGVERDPVLSCGLLRAHAAAIAALSRGTAARRSAAALVERYCGRLEAGDQGAAAAAVTCPRLGLQRGMALELAPGLTIRFNDRSAIVTRGTETREQPLAGGPLCRTQVVAVRHTPIDPSPGTPGGRHLIEFVTLQSIWHDGLVSREMVWHLYEVRGLDLDLAAVQRWQEPGSAWPAPALPDALARGAAFTVRGSGQIEYQLADDPPRRGILPARTLQ
jgi:hypothetical protein